MAAVVQPSVAMEAVGTSESGISTQGNQEKIASAFLAYIKEANPDLSEKWGLDWAEPEVPEEHACTQEIFAHLATFLIKTYKIPAGRTNAGEPFKTSSAKTVWSGLLQFNKKRFGKS